MKKYVILPIMLLAGCGIVPSFYDDNESYLAANLAFAVTLVNCERPPITFKSVSMNTKRLKLYSELKGSTDVVELVNVFEKSLDPVLEKKAITTKYCELKKKLLLKQSSQITETIMRRYK